MKKSLGRLVLLLLVFLHVEIFASAYEWSASANKSEAYVGEAIHLKYTCKFSDRGELYIIDLNPEGDYEEYTLHLLKKYDRIEDSKLYSNYEFIAVVKVAKKIVFDFDVIMKKTTKESIENTVIGRDNKEYEDFTKKRVKLKPLHVEVKKSKSELVGDFKIDVKKDDLKIKAFAPYHMEVAISGTGNMFALKPLEFKIDGVKVFASKVSKNINLTEDGYSGTWSQQFAFVGSQSFEIKEVNIEYFSLLEKQIKSLNLGTLHVEVKESYKKEDLLDEE
ncbi:hypothetical protein N9A28_10095, partial [Sulfurimonas sp.]|nr:hypothetical protein [Sulfurimonas sp.]